jgi:hypothetical protein
MPRTLRIGERDDFWVEVVYGDDMTYGQHSIGSRVNILIYDIVERPHIGRDFIAGTKHPAPTPSVYEPNTRNHGGTLGAYRDVWADDWQGEWLESRITRAIAAARKELAQTPELLESEDE